MNSPRSATIVKKQPKPNIEDQSRNQLIVDFPARRYRRQEDRHVRFASHHNVRHIPQVRDVCSKRELWYSDADKTMMKRKMYRDAYDLAQKLLSPSDKVLQEGIDMSQVVGLDKLVNPIERKRVQNNLVLQRHALICYQDDVQDEDELRRISESFSRASSDKARTLALYWVKLDKEE